MNPLRALLAFVAALLLQPGAAAAQATVAGTISYDDVSVPMTHVSARETRPSPHSDRPGDVVILIADRPAPAAIAASRRAYHAAAEDGRIRGLLIVLKPPPDENQVVIFAPGGGVADTRLPDPFERIALTDLVREGGFVSGRLRTAEPVEFVGGGAGPGEPVSYAADLRFRAAVVPAPRPTEVLTGEAARRSEQAAVAVEGLRLIHTASVAEIAQVRARLHPEHPPWPGLDSEEAEAILAVARQTLPSPAAFQQSIERVIVYGDDAIVVGRDSAGSSAVSLRRDGGEWKLAAAPLPND